ncbi:MAG TPA: hypothetical protein VK425_12225, partial [Acidimicrobiales bacterium]|nr:hypothetical protein [Acidimicrobiales bacterium]
RIYAAPDLCQDARLRDRALSFLHDEMQLPFLQPDGRPVVSSCRLAAEEVAGEKALSRAQVEQIERRLEGMAARTEVATFEDLLVVARGLADS